MEQLDERHIHDGHRKRMQEKLIRHDGDIFESYELLEMLLFFRLPYKNTNPIAKRLLHRFGSLRGVFEARAEELCEISGVGVRCAEFLRGVGQLLDVEGDDDAVGEGEEYVSEDRIIAMFHSLFSENKDASFAIVALDNSNRIIATETLYGVDFNSGSLNAVYYTDFALKRGASMIFTASNRRYGSTLPKPSDRESAMMASRALNSIDVLYGEHFVFAGPSYARVLPTLAASLAGKGSLFNGVVSEINEDSGAYVNKCCHNDAVMAIFGEVISAFCVDHSEKTKTLFERFGSISSVLITDYPTLSEMVGSPLAIFVRVLANIAKRRITDLIKLSDITNDAELADYLSALCIPLNRECVFLISYDSEGRVISIDKAGEGTMNSSGVTPRSLVEIAMRHSAKRVSVAHNHPYGKNELSDADIVFTKALSEAFASLGIDLIRHFCISERGVIAVSAPFDNL